MTIFVVTAFIAVIFQITGSQARHAIPDTDSPPDPCASVRCESGVCRLLSRRTSYKSFYVFEANPYCVPCVPKGVDAVCNRNNFQRALTVGNPLRPDTLKRQYCLMGVFRGKDACPSGNTCVKAKGKKRSRRGVCCYGYQSQTPVSNGDPKCPDLCPQPCWRGQSCQKCGDGFACLPKKKPGRCYRPKKQGRYSCWTIFVPHPCRSDDDCEGSMKCCVDRCNRGHCIEPKNKPPRPCPTTTTTTTTTEPATTTTMEATTEPTTEETTTTTSTTTTSTTTEPTTEETTTTTSTTTTSTEPPF